MIKPPGDPDRRTVRRAIVLAWVTRRQWKARVLRAVYRRPVLRRRGPTMPDTISLITCVTCTKDCPSYSKHRHRRRNTGAVRQIAGCEDCTCVKFTVYVEGGK